MDGQKRILKEPIVSILKKNIFHRQWTAITFTVSIFTRCNVLVFANDFEYVVVCKGAVAAVDGQYAVFGDFLQCFS